MYISYILLIHHSNLSDKISYKFVTQYQCEKTFTQTDCEIFPNSGEIVNVTGLSLTIKV